MATNLASFSPTIDLSSLERALSRASALSDRTLREMQKNVEAFNKKYLKSVGAVADSSLDISKKALDRFQSAYTPPSWDQAVQDDPVRPYSEALRKQHAAAELEVAKMGMSKRRAGLADQLFKVDEGYYAERDQFEQANPLGAAGPDGANYQQQLEDMRARHTDMTNQVLNDYDMMSQARGDWMVGASAAWQEYLDTSSNVAAQSQAVFASVFDRMGTAVQTFATTGKLSFSDFAKSVIADMAALAAKTAASKALSSLLGFGMNLVGSWFGSGSTPAPTSMSVGGTTTTFTPQLDVSSLKFAKGGAFTNSVATGPTLAPMALFGEAGPEAIMPLTRGADGALGVRALGGGSGASHSSEVVIQQTINVAAGDGNATAGEGNAQRLANAYAGAARQGASEQISRELMPGGQIWSAIHGR
ncbi:MULTISPECIES: phage tail tape measure protein [unclassified Pseudomonas]|uniref:phage tail tape measure protein n=1 Tax=unclassified Pseudomonas TaxID=196821 RepID=UPI00244B7287|nr:MULTISPECIES: phage tail tape measure protein [unclassified Pseudomonas]MDH0300600.1 phage tail tape measure protein [Pseudomonas sp. GD04091]MDH1984249.1 phage tail tape measure protein [Pseudomonas sp. GD03689]